MALMMGFLILWIVILGCNVIYSFLPSHIQSIGWIKNIAIIIALLIFISGIIDEIKKYQNFRFANISASNGMILKKKNFPWDIIKSKTAEGNIVYVIKERYGDASEIAIKPKKQIDYRIDSLVSGIGIVFFCPENEIPNFTIIIPE